MKIRAIKTEQDYNEALARLEKIFHAEVDSPEGDEAEILGTLISNYENEHYPVAMPDPIEAIKFMMEQRRMNNADLGELLGSPSRASEILNLKRGLTLEMVRTLHAVLQIPTEILVQPYALKGNEKAFMKETLAKQQERSEHLKKMNARFHPPHNHLGLKSSKEPTKSSSNDKKAYPIHGRTNSQVNEGRKNLKRKKSNKDQE